MKKKGFCLLLKAGRHAKAGRLHEGVTRICLFLVEFKGFDQLLGAGSTRKLVKIHNTHTYSKHVDISTCMYLLK